MPRVSQHFSRNELLGSEVGNLGLGLREGIGRHIAFDGGTDVGPVTDRAGGSDQDRTGAGHRLRKASEQS